MYLKVGESPGKNGERKFTFYGDNVHIGAPYQISSPIIFHAFARSDSLNMPDINNVFKSTIDSYLNLVTAILVTSTENAYSWLTTVLKFEIQDGVNPLCPENR